MAAIVLDDEEANGESGGQHRETEREPIGVAQTQVHQVVASKQRNQCIKSLPKRNFDGRYGIRF